jgi:DNA modification methylase
MKWHLEKRLLADLREWETNPRDLTTKGIADLRKSIEKFGCAEPLVINTDNTICGGHGRKKVLTMMGIPEVDCYLPDKELTAKEFKELNVRLNKNIAGTFNMDILSNNFEVSDLNEWGFEDFELGLGADINPGLTDPDECPDAPSEAKTKPGDLWLLGEHRLLCGSGADHDDVIKVMGGDLAQCVFTDPPYGVSIGKKNVMLNSFQKAGKNLTDIVDDDLSPEELKANIAPAFAEIKNTVMADDCTVFVCSPQGGGLGMMMMMMMMMQESCHRARHVLIWKKNSPTFSMGRLDYDYQHEPILLTWGKKHKRPMLGTHKTSVWEIDKPRANKEHPTMKPVELYTNAFLNNSDKGDVVYDGYGGSGTCIIAAEQTGRKARVIELSPHYCDVIINRWQKFTGKEAVHENGTKWNAFK